MSVFVSEAAARDALRCCIFWAALRARYPSARRMASRFTSAIGLNGYAERQCREHSGRRTRSQRCFLGGGQTEGASPSPPPLKDHRLNGMLKKRVVVFTLLRERQSFERSSAR